ncbi:hypothetical protein [Cohnella silvisoli]|uniref:Uncharacterized protein n=1 Tax=Cohnella silvisoli TaxID=2873699 RepID=A0ABV1KX55_9BACL|nr:hypothetical protein [Cohnella silvisoli]MCD9023460.1 hypothetical protein [Cohnella silvisoli]
MNPKSSKDSEKLIDSFIKLGCKEPESWVESELEEDIPQLSRYRFLRGLKGTINHYKTSESWIDYYLHSNALSDQEKKIGEVLGKIIDSGVSKQDIGLLASTISLLSVHSVLYRIDDPYDYDIDDGEDLPSWSLVEINDKGEPTGRTVSGLFESLNSVINEE